MASGKIHSACSIGLGIALSALPIFDIDPLKSIATGLGSFSGVFITPDLDVDGGNISHKKMRKEGRIFYLYWKHFWLPYALALKHREHLSHMPILGTTIRLVYIAFPFIVIPIYKKNRIKKDKKFFLNLVIASILSAVHWFFILLIPPEIWQYFGFYAIGLVFSDTIHYILDILT